jgi:hypothetical protein
MKKRNPNTLCLSWRLVSITTDEQFFSHTIRQKSLNVLGSGPRENKYTIISTSSIDRFHMTSENSKISILQSWMLYVWFGTILSTNMAAKNQITDFMLFKVGLEGILVFQT